MQPDDEPFTPNIRVLADRYDIIGEVGRGGMAVVLLATDRKHKRRVAVKVLRDSRSGTVRSDRFLREIHIAAGLMHPHILSVHDSGVDQGILYYVMPYVEGETLAARITREGALPVDDVIRLVRQIGSALQHAHDQGIVHRDIKPENVLLPGGVAVVADFGLARAVEPDPDTVRLTDTGFGLGTPKYISPEQALGDRELDARSDQYSFAVMIYEMLAGRPPFEGTTGAHLISQHLTKAPVPIVQLRADVPFTVADALARALEKDPERRFESVREFMKALEGAPTYPSLTAMPAPPARGRFSRRSMVGVGAAMLVVAAGAVGAKMFGGRTPVAGDTERKNLIAVAPFNVLDSTHRLWREGMMDVLYRAWDGAGQLRSVSPTLIVRAWKETRADRTTVVELARELKAGIAVFGTIEARGADSVRATVTLYDADGDSTLGSDFVFLDLASRMDRIGDSVAAGVLTRLGRLRGITAAARPSALGSQSVPAIKAFLQGEQRYRVHDFVNAQVAYEGAIAADTMFALAYRRLSNVVKWRGSVQYDLFLRSAHRAGALNRDLTPRDSLLVLADSLLPDVSNARFLDPATLARGRRRIAILEQAALQYPSDPEVWAELGEARARSTAGTEPSKALEAFERAIAADSLFGPNYPTAIDLALASRPRDSILVLTRRYLRINPLDKRASIIDQVLNSKRADADLTRILATTDSLQFQSAAIAMGRWPDPDLTAVRMFELVVDRRNPQGAFGMLLALRGRVADAAKLNDHAYRFSSRGADLLLFLSRYSPDAAAAMDSLANARFASDSAADWPLAITRAADRRDTLQLRRLAGVARSRAASGRERAEWSYVEGLSSAYYALARADSSGAVRAFEALPDSLAWPFKTIPAVIDAARLLTARGRAVAALSLLDRHPAPRTGASPWHAVWYLEVARAAAAAGDASRARRSLQYVTAAWLRADRPVTQELENVAASLRRAGIKP